MAGYRRKLKVSLQALQAAAWMGTLLPFAVGAEALAGDFSIKKQKLLNCAQGTGYVATFDFSDPWFHQKHEVVVLNRGPLLVQQAVQALRDQGYQPLAVINGGFFADNGREIYSYYKSTRLGSSLPTNSANAPRACGVFDRSPKAELLDYMQSDSENYEAFKENRTSEIFCAGPQLIRDGKNVSLEQYCKERFDPRCRPEGDDPGIGYHSNFPRSASCVTASGELKLFHFNSDTRRCGTTLGTLTQILEKEGCVSGMNHDGGGSAKLYLNEALAGGEGFHYSLGAGTDRGRRVPVWVAVVQKAARR